MDSSMMQQLMQIFFAEAKERFDDIEHYLAVLAGAPDDPEALDALMRRFHSLAGVGGIEGIETVNRLSARVETECRQKLAANESPSPKDLHLWAAVLEVLKSEVAEIEATPLAEEDAQPQPVANDSYDVLVVDDDREIHAALSAQLQQEGISMRSAYSVAEAMQVLDGGTPSAIVADVGLPDGSGYDVIQRLRSVAAGEAAPAIMISRRDAFVDKLEGIRCGSDAYFCKPFDAHTLVRKLTTIQHSRDTAGRRILSVEDDPAQAAFIRTILEDAGYDVLTCSDPSTFENDVATFAPDLILMDIVLPGVSGYELARMARQIDDLQNIPLLFLTTESHLRTRIETIRSGGDDHIVKPVSPMYLLTAVEARLERSRQIREAVDRDNLTLLFNRGAFHRAIRRRLLQRRKISSAVVMIDVDHFKRVNDTHGHAGGDRVLVSLAAFLRSHVRISDTVCRYGGEEFAMLVDDVDEDEAVRLVDRIRREFAAVQHGGADGRSFCTTFSAGVSLLPDRSYAVAHAIEAADAALYRAKAAGRNTVYGASSDLRLSA